LEKTAALEPVFIGSSQDDLSAFSRYRIVAGAPLGEVKSLIANASMFVGNDSGPAHIAAAFEIPVVVLYGRPEHQVVWAPWKAAAARTLVSPDGISAIRTVDVIEAIAELRVQCS
jgi:ADP-heptose:LPS heptosyltransferase